MKKESLTLRLILIILLTFLLLIPLAMIQSLINERQSYRNEALRDIYSSWAREQTIAGPILTVETEILKENKPGEKSIGSINKHYLPSILEINCELIPEVRYRGIYELVLYRAKIKMKGFFEYPDLKDITGFKASYVSFNVGDLRGIEENINLKWNGIAGDVNPGLKNKDVLYNGFHSNINVDNKNDRHEFELQMLLRGSEELSFIPVGKSTEVKINSTWNNPSFTGSYLPSKREIAAGGFNSTWKINHFNRDYPQNWDNKNYEIFPSSFGVKLLMPIDEYQKTMRTSKYGIMIIILTFVSFFMIEIFSKKVIHPIQYSLIGLSLILFYSILLSISEYMIFQYSYLISAVMVIILIGFYVKSIYSNLKIGAIISLLLLIFYGFMYVILQLQDYSLLLGNIALFIILALIMFITRKINWYDVLSGRNEISINK
jgi:inner membrane protein